MCDHDKLYIITRSDIPPGSMAVQAMHAMRKFIHEHPLIETKWFHQSNHICFLQVDDETTLHDLIDKALWEDFKYSQFREPDLNNSLTAIVLEPKAKRMCDKLSLALHDCKSSHV